MAGFMDLMMKQPGGDPFKRPEIDPFGMAEAETGMSIGRRDAAEARPTVAVPDMESFQGYAQPGGAVTPGRSERNAMADAMEARRAQVKALGGNPDNIPTGGYSAPGTMAEAMTAASKKARMGGQLADYDAEVGYDRAAGPSGPSNLAVRAGRGDEGAANQLADLFGGSFFRQIMAEPNARERTRQMREAMPAFLEQQKGYRAALGGHGMPEDAEAAALRKAEAKEADRESFARQMATDKANLERTKVEGGLEVDKAKLDAQTKYQNRLAEIEDFRAKYPAQKDEADRLERAAERELKQKQEAQKREDDRKSPKGQLEQLQVETAQGKLTPGQVRDAEVAITEEARALAASMLKENPSLGPSTAARKALEQLTPKLRAIGKNPGDIKLAGLSPVERKTFTPLELNEKAKAAGFDGTDAMLKAMQSQAFRDTNEFGNLAGWGMELLFPDKALYNSRKSNIQQEMDRKLRQNFDPAMAQAFLDLMD